MQQMNQMNSGFSSLSFNSSMSQGVIQKPDVPIPMSPMSSTMDGSFRSFVPQEEPPYYPSSPMSPIFHQQNRSQKSRTQSLGDDYQGMAPRNNFASSPVIHSKRTFSPRLNAPISLDGRSSQFSSGNNQLDPLASFLPPPPNLDAYADASHQIGRLDNTGLFLSENDNQPKSPFLSTPRNRGNHFHDANLNRERALSSPGIYLRQPSFGSPLPAPSGQILYEDKPSSWNEGSRFPAPNLYNEGAMPSPSNYDRFNSRPPRHCGTKDAQALHSPRIEMRHTTSDGNFNFPSAMPIASHMSPVANNHGRSQSNIASGVIGSPSFDSSFQAQAGHLNDRNSFRNVDALNSNMNFVQYQSSHSSPMPPGITNSARMQQDNYYMQQSPAPPNLQRHHSTGSQHFLVNERGEIVGHASPVITHNSFEGFAQGEPRNNNFPPNRPQRANSYGGQQHASPFNQIQSQQRAPPNFNPVPIPFQSDAANNSSSSPMDNYVGSIGDGRMQHHRHNTEPIPPTVFNPNSGGNIHSRHPVSATSGVFDQALAGENIEGIEVASEEIRSSSEGGAVEEKTSGQSYASKLMMPSPQPAMDSTKGRVASQLLTAGASLAKSGPRMIFNVKFKRSQRSCVLGQRVTREIKIGCYVKVEADRGEDLGIVMSIVPMEKFLASTNRHRSMTEDSIASGDPPSPSQAANIGDLKRIMRVATHDEITLLEVKREEEEELLKICCTKVRQRGLPMSVVDAEYQFDRNKLTFFFQAEGRVDFRELVRDLFSMYKTRIWMQQLDKNGSPDEAKGDTADEW